MERIHWGAGIFCLTLAACNSGGPRVTTPEAMSPDVNVHPAAMPQRPAYRVNQVQPTQQLPLTVQVASSTGVFQNQLYGPLRAVDNNENTEWISTDTDANPELSLSLNANAFVERVSMKTWPGSRFIIQLYRDGEGWRDATGQLSSASWQQETYAVNGTGRQVKVRFLPPPPAGVRHFSVFEIRAFGWYPTVGIPGGIPGGITGGIPGGPVISPAAGLTFLDAQSDRVGAGGQVALSGTMDGHFRLALPFDRTQELLGIDLYGIDPTTSARTGAHWSSRVSAHWILGVLSETRPTILAHSPSLGAYGPGLRTFDLYAENYGGMFTTPGTIVEAEATFPDATRTFRARVP